MLTAIWKLHPKALVFDSLQNKRLYAEIKRYDTGTTKSEYAPMAIIPIVHSNAPIDMSIVILVTILNCNLLSVMTGSERCTDREPQNVIADILNI